VYREVERIALGWSDRVIAVDMRTGEEYARRYPWLGDRLCVIPNGVDASSFLPMDRGAAKRKWRIDGTAFLYAGRLEPEKRVLDIVRAFRSVENGHTTLLIAGDGTQRSVVEAAARGLPVRLLGDVTRSEIPSLLNASDAVVLFSEREGLPMVALEALACGTPVIATAVGDLPGLVRQGETGYLVSNTKDLEFAMRQVRDGTIQTATSIAMSVASYDWREIGRRILRVYQEVHDARAR
jgi:glycosyltransferase involved in cell wall biosynthesis